MKIIITEEQFDRILNNIPTQSENGDIQMYIDIIDNLDKNDIKRNKYIKILKDKYDYDYIENDDDENINGADINNIKNINDFKSYKNYKTYSEKIFEIRTKNIDYSKFYGNKIKSIDRNQLINLLEKYNIKSSFINGYISHPTDKINKNISWAGDTIDSSHILHEIGHFFDDDIKIPTTYSLTDYGLTNIGECTAESIMLFLLNPKYYNELLPNVGKYIQNKLPKWVFKLRNELIYENNYNRTTIKVTNRKSFNY